MVIAFVPACLTAIFLFMGSLDLVGLNSQAIFYNKDQLDPLRVVFAILISVICIGAGFVFKNVLKRLS